MIKLTVKTAQTDGTKDQIGIKETTKKATIGEYMTIIHHATIKLLNDFEDVSKKEIKEIIDKVGE